MESEDLMIDNLNIFLENELFQMESYQHQLEKIRNKESKVLIINYEDLPDEYRTELENNYYGLVRETIKNQVPMDDVAISFKNVPITKKVRELESADINKLITINGLVINSLQPRSIVRRAVFRCQNCNELITKEQYAQVLEKPDSCSHCNGRIFIIEEKECKWDDYQEVVIQENPDETEVGAVPRTLKVVLVGKYLVNRCKPGDVINLTGILSLEQHGRGGGRVFNWFIIGNFIDILTKDAFSAEISDEDIAILRGWGEHPRIKDILIKSIYPSIYGWEEEKYGLTLCLFGGVERKGTDINFRGSSNCLLIGDPSTAKTAMITAATKVAPKAIYTQAGGSSGVGLTASAVKDGDTWGLAAGAVVLANGGICCIDEIEKMDKEDRDKLHEAMEVQTVSIHKATVHATLNAKTTILAAGNPKYGRYDPATTVADNIDLQPTILSRFDLIYIMRDIPDKEKDEGIVTKIFESMEGKVDDELPLMDTETVKKYILYAKSMKPVLETEAKAKLGTFYLSLRKEGGSNKPIPIAPRQFQGMVRLTQASARMSLREVATEEDAELAIQLIMNTLSRANIDPTTGEMDTAMTENGKSISKTNKEKIFREKFPVGIFVTRDEAYNEMSDIMTRQEFEEYFRQAMGAKGIKWLTVDVTTDKYRRVDKF